MTAVTLAPASTAVTRPAFRWERLWWVPLAMILAAQAVLSARLIWNFKPAGPDEARYIWAGHQLFYELWHGGGSPYFETYFSGAPVFFSPIAAIADHIGGIAEVRLMNLCFMLCATVLLFVITRRLFGYLAALTAVVLFSGLGLAHDIGVYGNYDSLALMLMAAATYCAVRSNERKWLLLLPAALLAANAAKYMTLLFDPVVIAIAALQAQGGWKRIWQRAGALTVSVIALLILITALAGGAYVKGIIYTTVNRPSHAPAFSGAFPATRFILLESWSWIGVPLVLGACAVLLALARRSDGKRTALLAVLLAAGIGVTLEALHLHSDESMRQHDPFSAWYAVIAAGYFVSTAIGSLRFSKALAASAVLACVILAVPYWTINMAIAQANYEPCAGCRTGDVGIPASYSYYRMVDPYLHSGRLLVGYESFQLTYDSGINVPWFRLFDDIYLKYPIPGRGGDSHGQTPGPTCLSIRPHCMYLEGPAAYRAAIRAHWFSLISMYKGHFDAVDDQVIIQAVEHTPGYVVLTRTGQAPTWIYAPDYERHAHAR
jgi:hypothetical protein